MIDLTHTLLPTVPHWSGSCGFQMQMTRDYADSTAEVKFRVQNIEMCAGVGTHMDAPAHCIAGGTDIAGITLQQLIVPCVGQKHLLD